MRNWRDTLTSGEQGEGGNDSLMRDGKESVNPNADLSSKFAPLTVREKRGLRAIAARTRDFFHTAKIRKDQII